MQIEISSNDGPDTSTNTERSRNSETKEDIHYGHYVGFNSEHQLR